jgi:hypothetical protein
MTRKDYINIADALTAPILPFSHLELVMNSFKETLSQNYSNFDKQLFEDYVIASYDKIKRKQIRHEIR